MYTPIFVYRSNTANFSYPSTLEANGSESDEEERGEDNLYDEVPDEDEDGNEDDPSYERMQGDQLYAEVPQESGDEDGQEEEYE